MGGTPHIRIGLDTAQNSELGGGGTPHKKICSDIYTGVGTPHITPHTTQNQGGTPHKKMCSDVHTGLGTPHRIQSRLLAGWLNDYSANPGSILQAETCKILSLAENPSWS